MKKLASSQFIIFLSCLSTTLGLTFIFLRLVNHGQCLESNLVSQVQSIGGGSEIVEACSLIERMKPQGRFSALAERINRLQGLVPVLPSIPQPMHVLVNENNPFTYHAYGKVIEVGSEFVDQPNSLELVLIKNWLRLALPHQDELIAEVFGAFFLSTVRAEL